MRLPRFSKKAVALAAAVGIVMGAGGVAAAYYSTTGTGKGTTSLESINATGTFTVTTTAATYAFKDGATPAPTGLMPSLPGTTNESYATYTWTVTNKTEAYTHLAKVTVSIDKTGTTAQYTETVSGTPTLTKMTGCKGSWFLVGTTSTAPATADPATTSMTVTLTDITLGPHSNATTNHHTKTYTIILKNTTTATQAPCEAHSPEVKIAATSTS